MTDLPNLVFLLQSLSSLSATNIKGSSQWQLLKGGVFSKEDILLSLPHIDVASLSSLRLLHTLLTELPGAWPPLILIKCFAMLSKGLSEDEKTSSTSESSQLLTQVARLAKSTYGSFADFIDTAHKPALRSTCPSNYITHNKLHSLSSNFRLPIMNNGRKAIVAIALTNGPLLGAVCVAVASTYTAAPINPDAGQGQFKADLIQSRANWILTTSDQRLKLGLDQHWVTNAGIGVGIVEWSNGDDITISIDGESLDLSTPNPETNQADDIALVLFTSGTSGVKKVVPITLHSLIASTAFVVEAWALTNVDICLNMMPLYHVGGLVRNILSPIFSKGSTVCCSAFDPSLFWDVIDEIQPTWYYASPSMHSIILEEWRFRPKPLTRGKIRLVCNAAGGLLPSLACQLQEVFDCTVLPSYGMTECMPISTPPIDYKLDREGTSGISTGPELTILNWGDEKAPTGEVGRICVRGEPVFPGYLLPDGTYDRSPFNIEGWFDTGDLGYIDSDGFLYITGRSKEVINRGGELISPFEVENAIMSASSSPSSALSGRVTQALAFSASHAVLQEVVAVALVTPPGVPRVDLRTLHQALRISLQQVKWPVLITYMDDLPKKNNKLLRINLCQRLGLPELNDSTPYLSRHWEAVCPDTDTDLSICIESSSCSVNYQILSPALSSLVGARHEHFCQQRGSDGSLEIFIAPRPDGCEKREWDSIEDIKLRLARSVHNYMIPEHVHLLEEPLPRQKSGEIDIERLNCITEELLYSALGDLERSTAGKVTKAFANILGQPPTNISPDVGFFELGGDSLKAGGLVSYLRSTFNIQMPISVIFNQGTVNGIARYIDEAAESIPGYMNEGSINGSERTCSSTNPLIMMLQLVPLVLVYPLRRALQWTIFLVSLSYVEDWPTSSHVIGRLFNLTLCIVFSRVCLHCIAPIGGICAKWLIIGRYKEGLYPMWGFYHTRWWMVQKIVSICGKGIFSSTDGMKRLYCRLMGAKIGKNVKLAGTALGEWDLLDIRDGAVLTRCVCRPFAVEGNTSMYLGRIVVGENCSIGLSSIVSAGSEIPANTCIGPNSSSWEMQDADEENRDLSPSRAPKPHWALTLLFTTPLSFLAWALSLVPWAGGLVGMVLDLPSQHDTPLRRILDWFTEGERIGYHYLALALRSCISPFILFGFTIIVKSFLDLLFGQLQPGQAKGRGQVEIWRMSLMKTLLPVSRLHDVTSFFGQHYEATSKALRMLGARVGERVYWPGTGPSIGDYHLLEIGNDVVFGSRAHLITSDGDGSEKIVIKDRAMIADRVCLLPGVEVGEHAIMGSGSLGRRGKAYSSHGTFVGSKGRDAINLSTSQESKTAKSEYPSRIRHMSSDDTLASGIRTDANYEQARTKLQPMNANGKWDGGHFIAKDVTHETMCGTGLSYSSDSDTDGNTMVASSANLAMTPFGRAFYLKLAPYYVLGPFAIFCYSTFTTLFTKFYWNFPSIASVQIVVHVMDTWVSRNSSLWFEISILFLLTWAAIAILVTFQAILALVIVVAAKWALLGRRVPGNYDWDKSSYCQRWQIFLAVEKLRRQCFRGQGVLGLLTGTNWIVLYFKALGCSIGKDCALFANGSPSLMFTEPDLITLGNRVAIDDASVVAHINSRGKFDLNKLEIGDRCVLRSGSRLLSGAAMKDDSCLLEHTLIMGGDIVEEKWTMQGWPAEKYIGQRINKLTTV